jgi:hypothetical protein
MGGFFEQYLFYLIYIRNRDMKTYSIFVQAHASQAFITSMKFSHLLTDRKFSSFQEVLLLLQQHCKKYPNIYMMNKQNHYRITDEQGNTWFGTLREIMENNAQIVIDT